MAPIETTMKPVREKCGLVAGYASGDAPLAPYGERGPYKGRFFDSRCIKSENQRCIIGVARAGWAGQGLGFQNIVPG